MPDLKREKMTKEQTIETLKTVIKNLEDDTFEGCLSFSNLKNNESFIIVNKGFAEDRIFVIDSVFISIYLEPIQSSRDFMLLETYNRWKHYFGALYQHELTINGRIKQ